MERHLLVRLLAGDDEASAAALAALLNGATYVVWDGTSPAESLARTYARAPPAATDWTAHLQARRRSPEQTAATGLLIVAAVNPGTRPGGSAHPDRPSTPMY